MHGCARRALAIILTGLVSAAWADPPRLIDYRQITLDNGLKVITSEDFSCPIVAVHLWYHVGSKDEDPQRTGFAHMFEHMMFRGTDRLGSTDHFDLLRRTGGNCNAYTSFDQTVYVQTVPANQLELVLWLEAERMSFLKIDQESFDTERKVVEEERRLGLNRPYGTLAEKMTAEIFKVHPYQWTPIGNIAHLRASTVQELRDFWTRYYVPNNATLVVVGAVSHDEAQRLARKCFGWIPRYDDPPRVTVVEPLPTEARTITLREDNAPAPVVGLIWRGVPVGHRDIHALNMLASILGGGESSRIYRDLVAERQLAVFAASAALPLEQAGIVGVGAVLSPLGGKPEEVMAAVEQHVERLRTELVTEKELTKARNQALRSLVTETLTVVSKASALGGAAVLEGDVDNVNRRIEAIRAVTAEDLRRVANEYLAADKVLRGKVESNLLGSIFGRRKNTEDDAPITAAPETEPPAPGRPGLSRPADFPTEPPSAAMLPFDSATKYETRTLANGLKVLIVENHEVPFVTMQLGMLAGAWTEQKPGTASLAASMLTKGTATRSEAELAEELDLYAIALGGSASLDSASVSASCLTEHTPRAMALLAEAVRTPTFPDKEFEKLRNQLVTGLTISTNEPGYIADRELRRQLFGAHPYARTPTGEIEDVKKLTADDLRQWWTTFARPDMAVLIFAGDIDPARAEQLAAEALGDWQATGPKPSVELPPLPERESRQIYLVDFSGVQSQIRVGQIGIRRDHPDYFTSRVAGGYFGGAFSSRLNETIRVKKGLTYGARGGWSAERFAGQFTVSTFSKTATTIEAVKAIFDELDRLRDESPTDKELGSTRSYLLGSFAGERETPQAVASQLWMLQSMGLPEDYYDRYLKAVAQTSAEDCVRLARTTVDPEKSVVIVVGPASRLQKELEQIGPVTVLRPDGQKKETPASGEAQP